MDKIKPDPFGTDAQFAKYKRQNMRRLIIVVVVMIVIIIAVIKMMEKGWI